MLGDSRQHLTQIAFRLDAVEFGASDQAIHGGGAFASRLGAGEDIVFSSQRDGTKRALHGVVVYFSVPIMGERIQRLPTVKRVLNGTAQCGLAR